MRLAERIMLGFAVFLAVAGTVYATTAYEWKGTVLLLVCAVAFLYVSLVLRAAVRRASVPVTEGALMSEEVSLESEHIGPTIWPFVLSLAAVLLVIGLVALHWVLIPTGILLVGAGAGWFLDIKQQRRSMELESGPGTASAGASGLQDEQEPDNDHRH